MVDNLEIKSILSEKKPTSMISGSKAISKSKFKPKHIDAEKMRYEDN